jgi:hypothetical protein
MCRAVFFSLASDPDPYVNRMQLGLSRICHADTQTQNCDITGQAPLITINQYNNHISIKQQSNQTTTHQTNKQTNK